MKTGSFAYLSLLGLAAAQPQHGHRHADYHKKRGDVVVTDIQTVLETAPAAVVYVDDEGNILYTSTQTPTVAVPETMAAVPTSAAVVSAEAWSAPPHSYSKPPPSPATTLSTSSTPTTSTTPTTTSTPTPTTTPTTTPEATTATSLAGGPSGYIGGSSSAPAASAPASSNSGYGIAYSPYNNDGSCKTQSEVSSDFEQISDFSVVRSYGVDCNQVTTMLTAAKAKNMKILLGIFNIQPATQLAADIATLVAAVDGDWSSVHSISIGNEDVNQGKASVATVVSATNTGRTLLRAAGFQGDVVHVDTFNQLIENPEICQASDYAAANCHAFFDPNTDAAGAGAFVLKQAQAISKACGGMTTYITESGWPHSGDANGDAVPSPANQATALASLKSSFSSNIFLFSAFDTMWKTNNAGTFGAEQFWGFLS